MALLDWCLQKPLHNVTFSGSFFTTCPHMFHLINAHYLVRAHFFSLCLRLYPLCHIGHCCLRWCVCVSVRTSTCVHPYWVPFISWFLMWQLLLRVHSSCRCLCCSAGPLRTHQAIRRQLLGTGRHKIHPLASLWIIFRSEGLCVLLWALEQALWDRDLTDWRPKQSYVWVNLQGF